MTEAKRVEKELAQYFYRNGYVRSANLKRRKEDKQNYRKGDEVRLVAGSELELTNMRSLLDIAGFKAGRPFVKGRQFIQAMYGREAVARFLAMVAAYPAVEADHPDRRRTRTKV